MATHNRRHLVPSLVDAVLADPATLEIIVVDDAGSDGTFGLVAEMAVTDSRILPLSVDCANQLKALDEGIRCALGEIVLLLDDDVLPSPGLVTGHARHHAGRSGLVVLGHMPVAPEMMDEVTSRLYAAEYEASCKQLECGGVAVLDAFWTGNASLRRADALVVGLSSDAFGAGYHRDRDLGYRLAAAGLTGVFDRSLRSIHLHRRGRDSFLSDAAGSGTGLVLLHRLHADRLGELDLATLTEDLPWPLRVIVRRAGTSKHADRWSRLVWTGGAVAGAFRMARVETALIRLSRRIMRLRGATTERRRARVTRQLRYRAAYRPLPPPQGRH